MKAVPRRQQPRSACNAAVLAKLRAVTLPAAIVLGICATAVMGQPASSVLAGAYTEQQAIRGQALYYQHCLNCHGETLGGVDKAAPLAGPQFGGVWNGEPLWALVERLDQQARAARKAVKRCAYCANGLA